jgi:4-amino-4-deoxychorismate lyase
MNALIFRGNEPVSELGVSDRGLMYGDGLFETMRAEAGTLPWWDAHWQRLGEGAARLGIALPDESRMHAAALGLIGAGRSVLKLILTRGESGRGYLPGNGPSTCVLSVHPLPPPVAEWRLHWCQTAMAQQPVLAGMKHLNRLENVLARAECQRAGFSEGLMRDSSGQVLCATSANVFIHKNGAWQTPALDSGGIAGIARAWLLANVATASVAAMQREDVEQASAVFLCNAVRGIMPVRSVGDRCFPGSSALQAVQMQFLHANPQFSDELPNHG